MQIQNPVLRGFNPDPSILRVGEDYYIATSTFEWLPGIQLHHSRDLVHWELIGHALTRPSQLRLEGVIDSAGLWAPSLSWCDGTFFLLYSVLHTRVGTFKDVHNYLVTTEDIRGEWSEPLFLNSSGFDPSLFHDDDGSKWLINMQWDPRPGKHRFGGIVMQEYDHAAGILTGSQHHILRKPDLIEGPNLYKHAGRYYLMLAEGGTGTRHAISLARADCVTGPYEIDGMPFILSARDFPQNALCKTGHGSLVETPGGEWYVAYLCSRPLPDTGRCPLGRETAISRCHWTDDGWLRFDGGIAARENEPAPLDAIEYPVCLRPEHDDFDSPDLSPHWSWLRQPLSDTWLSVNARPGWLRLYGIESVHSLYWQSLLAQRLQEFHCDIRTVMEYAPVHFNQSAGLICWYDTKTHYYLRVTCDEILGKVVEIALTDDSDYKVLEDSRLPVGDWTQFHLRAMIDHADLRFYASPDGDDWRSIGPVLDASKLSDDYGTGLHFTGAFVGICAQDLQGPRLYADFDSFTIRQTAP